MIDAHQGAFEYDWRARFGKPLRVIGRSMSWGEALRLTRILSAETDSQVGAAIAGWSHPASRLDLTLRDLYDLQHQSKAKKRPKPYPRPWPDKTSRRFGRTRMTVAELRAVLDAHRE